MDQMDMIAQTHIKTRGNSLNSLIMSPTVGQSDRGRNKPVAFNRSEETQEGT